VHENFSLDSFEGFKGVDRGVVEERAHQKLGLDNRNGARRKTRDQRKSLRARRFSEKGAALAGQRNERRKGVRTIVSGTEI